MIVNNVTIYLFILIMIVSVTGYILKVLTISGVFAAMVVGVLIQLGFGVKGLALLGLFFGSSSMWSKFQQQKKDLYQEMLAKGEQRDYAQVFANGGISAVASLMMIIAPANVWGYVFIASLASANSDTWASEIGSLSKSKPFFISTFKRVEAGTSGAVSLLGTFAALAGAFLIATAGKLLWNEISFYQLVLLAFIGFAGNLIDTFLGAFVQVKYCCQECFLETEKKYHCGKKTIKTKGIPFFNNDIINFLSVLVVSVITFILM